MLVIHLMGFLKFTILNLCIVVLYNTIFFSSLALFKMTLQYMG